MNLFTKLRSVQNGDYRVRSKRTTRSIAAVYALIVFSGILIAANFYTFGITPLSDLLHEFRDLEIEHNLHDASRDVDEVLSTQMALATQLASRSAIRKRQAEYLQGKGDLDNLVQFSTAKLIDGMRGSRDMVGVARHGPDGKRLFAVGEGISDALSKSCAAHPTDSVVVHPLQISPLRLVYCSPILTKQREYLGFDVVVFHTDALQDALNSRVRTGMSFAMAFADGTIVFQQSTGDQDNAIAVLHTYLKTKNANGHLIRSIGTGIPDLIMHVVVDQAPFYVSIKDRLQNLTVMLGVVALMVLIVSVILLRPLISMLLNEQRLVEMATFDMLTGLLNANTFQGALDYELSRARRYRRQLSLIMFDVDFFKKVNDTYGHPVGDQVLRQIGQICKDSFRQADICARYGGEEFVVILPETGDEAAEMLAERLRHLIEQAIFHTTAGDLKITVSAGVLTWSPGLGDTVKSDMITKVDEALYASKSSGRNCVTVAHLPEPLETSQSQPAS